MKRLRIGFIGIGYRGMTHLRLCQQLPMADIVAVSDLNGLPQESVPYRVFSGNTSSHKEMLEQCSMDLVVISTPWELHRQHVLDALAAGVHVAVEVKGALSMQECWDIVEASQKSGKQVIPLENTCYLRGTLGIKQMTSLGLFGDLIYLQGGYRHDLRFLKVGMDGSFGKVGPDQPEWRANYSLTRNADLYPTHGLAPLCQMLHINRGNRIVSLSSFATKSAGIRQRIIDRGGAHHPDANISIVLGDVVTTILTTERGEQIVLVHDTNLPRPYSLNFEVQGTKGCWNGDLKGIYIEEDLNSRTQAYTPEDDYFDRYDHPLWKEHGADALRLDEHHKGMDYLMVLDIVTALSMDKEAPMNVYDLAVWSAITPLSEKSIAQGGLAQDFPDFGVSSRKN